MGGGSGAEGVEVEIGFLRGGMLREEKGERGNKRSVNRRVKLRGGKARGGWCTDRINSVLAREQKAGLGERVKSKRSTNKFHSFFLSHLTITLISA